MSCLPLIIYGEQMSKWFTAQHYYFLQPSQSCFGKKNTFFRKNFTPEKLEKQWLEMGLVASNTLIEFSPKNNFPLKSSVLHKNGLRVSVKMNP